MLNFVLGALVAASFVNSVSSECANACNGHGKCTAYDMCICNRNWQGNDCNQRTCQFGLAHVDTPKGDLDMDGTISGPNNHVVNNHPVYPYGTREQFPQMEDTDLKVLTESAHYYMECSNKGTCNRATGECQCFDGYDGVACQRASCPGYPNSCSGHGVCKTISQLASADYGNTYKLWDRDATMGCECDAGYYGADCSKRDCKHGVDPLYLDDAATAKVAVWDIAVLNTGTAGFKGRNAQGSTDNPNGYWALRFFDAHGEDWLTTSIQASGTDSTGATIATTGATCADVVKVLEELPNNVVPKGSILCEATTFSSQAPLTRTSTFNTKHQGHTYTYYYKMALWNDLVNNPLYSNSLPNSFSTTSDGSYQQQQYTGTIYRLKFNGNPGNLRTPEVELHLDGKRPSLISGTSNGKVVTFVSTDGQQGEDDDFFADHCDGVTVTIPAITNAGASATDYVKLSGLDATETSLLKKCLGDSDGDLSTNLQSDGSTANSDVQNWDYGSDAYPHLIKLVRTVTSYNDGGYYAALIFDGSNFKLMNPFIPPDTLIADSYDVYTTTGTLQRTTYAAGVSANAATLFGYGNRYVTTVVTNLQVASNTDDYNLWSGNLGCELLSTTDKTYVKHCMNHSDLFTVLAPIASAAYNPPYINLYRATRVWTTPYQLAGPTNNLISAGSATNKLQKELRRGIHVIETDLGMNWGADDRLAKFAVYKFVPAQKSTYNYVAPCSNRGICNEETGVCQCFPGYTSDSCSVQNSLAL